MATKPTSKPVWTEGNPSFSTVTQEPSGAKKQAGWFPSEKPPREFMNWLFWNLGAWVEYFEVTTDSLLAGGADLFVGSAPGMYATLPLAIAAANPGQRIVVTQDAAVASTISVTKANLEIVWLPGVTYSKSGTAICLSVTAAGVKLRGGRIVGFNASGNIGIQLSGCSNAMVRDFRFNDCLQTIVDTGTNNTVVGSIIEDAYSTSVVQRYTIPNNQSSAQAVGIPAFDKTKVKALQFFYDIQRTTDSGSYNEVGMLYVNYSPRTDTWYVHTAPQGDNANVDFSITLAGQLQCVTDNLAGSNYSGILSTQLTGQILRN